ncbi:dihydroorotate dehydrogenase electron transfer subunit [bacterium]|nr:dihydroorotate dehydrogenase electron transfer subunit [bacterium]
MMQFTTRLLANRKISSDYHQLVFEWDGGAGTPRPGQFVTLRSESGIDPLLKRPFAVAGHAGGQAVEIIIQIRGRVSRSICEMKPGGTLLMTGPLGNAFPMPVENTVPVLLAGGAGIGPIIFLYRELTAVRGPVRAVFGFRNVESTPAGFLESIAGDGPVSICTDNGGTGFRGTVIDYLRSRIPPEPGKQVMYACGPLPMMAAAYSCSESRKVPLWVSMEQVMACGIGACMGCVIRTNGKNPFARVCKDGPVFNAQEVVWT